MTWTTELPTENGWYWHRHSEECVSRAVHVQRAGNKQFVSIPRELRPTNILDMKGEWQGPIKPEEGE